MTLRNCLNICCFGGVIFISEKAHKTPGRKRRHKNIMGLSHAHRGGQSSNIGFELSEIPPAQGTRADIGHAVVVVTVAHAPSQIMKLGDVASVVTWSAFDIDSRHAGFARPQDTAGNAPWLSTPSPG